MTGLGRTIPALPVESLAQYRADLDRRLDRVLALPRCGHAAEKLRRRIARDREHLFVFITDRAVPATNNVSGVLGIIAKDVLGLHWHVKETELAFGRMRLAITGAQRSIELSLGTLLGLVLNKRTYPVPDFLYQRL